MATPFRSLTQFLIVAVTTIVIALAWIGAYAAIVAHQAASQARVEMAVRGKAALIAEQLRRELLIADQTLHILELEWEQNPAKFDFESWQRRVLALTDMSLQLFLSDARGIVRASSRAEILGDDISARDYFRAEATLPADSGRMFIGSLTRGLVTGRWQLNLARRLDRADGTFGGVIAASYDAAEFGQLQQGADLGSNAQLIVSARNGAIRGLGSLALGDPTASLKGSAVFEAMQLSTQGAWTGPSPLDGVERVFAFATIPDRALQVLVGVDRAGALRSANDWERQGIIFTAAATMLMLVMASVLLWADRSARIRHADAMRDRTVLAAAYNRLEAAERSERAKAAQLGATLAGMSDGIMMVDSEMCLIAWNEHFPIFTGVPPEILRPGLSMKEILRAQAAAGEFGTVDMAAEVDRRMSLLQRGESMGTIERHRPDGRILEIRRNRLLEGGFVTLYSDITARRCAEDRALQGQTMAAIGRLTSGIAHDFNNLLASITGNAEMLYADLVGSTKEARRVSLILQAAERGSKLIRQLLAFARKQALAPEQVNLNAILLDIAELLRTTLGSKVQLRMQLDPDPWLAIVDPLQIERVLLNLVINGRDAMPQGGLLTIRTGKLSLGPDEHAGELAAGDYVMIAVYDTGTGMSKHVLRNAFEPFFTTKPPGLGSGLGLSQAYGLARQSGGGIRIDSKLGQGTTVSVLLPRVTGRIPIPERPDVSVNGEKTVGIVP
jgi:signal transduction histidine kinase